jgi:hypothetical protein
MPPSMRGEGGEKESRAGASVPCGTCSHQGGRDNRGTAAALTKNDCHIWGYFIGILVIKMLSYPGLLRRVSTGYLHYRCLSYSGILPTGGSRVSSFYNKQILRKFPYAVFLRMTVFKSVILTASSKGFHGRICRIALIINYSADYYFRTCIFGSFNLAKISILDLSLMTIVYRPFQSLRISLFSSFVTVSR